MTRSRRPGSVRAIGVRRLNQATIGMVVLGAGGVGVLVAHDAATSHHAATTTVTSATSTDSSGSGTTDTATGTTNGSVTTTQSPPQATSGGS